jgi:hypothetical protein
MGSFFSKTFRSNPKGYQQLSNNSSKPVIPTIFYQVSIKKGSITNNKDKNDKIIKCLQVSDFLSRPINYKVKNIKGGSIYNNLSPKKPLFIFCCENTFEAIMTLHFSWIRMIIPKFPILILGSLINYKKIQNWNKFQFTPQEIKRLAYDSPNFSLEKIPLTFVYYPGVIDPNAIMQYYIKRQNINLADYDGVKLVFVQDFPDRREQDFPYRRECEILDSSKNSIFPGIWVNSKSVKGRIFMNSNPLVDSIFLPDYDTLMKINDFYILEKIEGYLRFLIMHYSETLKQIKNFRNIKLPNNYFFNYQNMRQILIEKIKVLRKKYQNNHGLNNKYYKRTNLKKTQQKPI